MQVHVENLVYNVYFKSILVGIILASSWNFFGIYKNLEVGSNIVHGPYAVHGFRFIRGRDIGWRHSDLGRRCCEGSGPRSPFIYLFIYLCCVLFFGLQNLRSVAARGFFLLPCVVCGGGNIGQGYSSAEFLQAASVAIWILLLTARWA